MQHAMFATGNLIVREGAAGDCAYIIEEGMVEIYVESEQGEISLAILSDGDIFGEMSLISGEPRSASARALAPTSVAIIHQRLFNDLIGKSDPIVSSLMKVVLRRFHETRERLLAANTGRQRHGNARAKSLNEHRETLSRFKFIQELAAALSEQQLFLLYQPIIDLATHRATGFEALVRWRHPHLGLVSPGKFIQSAEETKEIIPIGRWVIDTACADLKILQESVIDKQQGAVPWMSINVSPVQVQDATLADHFVACLTKRCIEPGSIKVELTESVLAENPQRTMNLLQDLKSLGMRIAIDDFGTGFSSLSYLHLFPVDTLKIDQSFVSKVQDNSRSREIVQTIVVLSKNLKLNVVAEGVETKEVETLLQSMGCHYGQGYLYSKPLPVQDCAMVLNRRELF